MKNKHTTADDVIRNNTCSECGETFPSARAKTAHFSVAHKDSRSKGRSYPKRGFKCKLCDKTFQAIEHRCVLQEVAYLFRIERWSKSNNRT